MSKFLNLIIAFVKAIFRGKQLAVPPDIDVMPSFVDDMSAIPEQIASRDGLQTQPNAAVPPPPPMFSHPPVLASDGVPALVPADKTTPVGKPLSPLFLDIYQGDYNLPDLKKVAADHDYYGVILKATEGNYYSPSWFLKHWDDVKKAAPDRYGLGWFRGAYCYLKFNLSGKAQAEYYVDFIEKAGGWDVGDLWPIVDVERGHEGGVNWLAKRQQVIDVTSEWATRAKELLGRPVMLYGNGIMRDLQIKSRMNCDWLWIPRYTEELPAEIYTRAGWSRDRLWSWQYYGDGACKLPRYPTITPLGQKGDISVLIMEGGLDRMRKELKVRL